MLTEYMINYVNIPAWEDSRAFITQCMTDMKAM